MVPSATRPREDGRHTVRLMTMPLDRDEEPRVETFLGNGTEAATLAADTIDDTAAGSDGTLMAMPSTLRLGLGCIDIGGIAISTS